MSCAVKALCKASRIANRESQSKSLMGVLVGIRGLIIWSMEIWGLCGVARGVCFGCCFIQKEAVLRV